MGVLSGHSDNRAVASELVRLLMGYEIPPGFAVKAEELLDAAYPSRRYRTPRPGAAFARNGDRATSKIAASRMNVAESEQVVLQCLMAADRPLTCHAIAERTQTWYGSITPRMEPLVKKGFIVDAGIDNLHRRPRTLWAITGSGREAARNG
jgi:hypothetical protein